MKAVSAPDVIRTSNASSGIPPSGMNCGVVGICKVRAGNNKILISSSGGRCNVFGCAKRVNNTRCFCVGPNACAVGSLDTAGKGCVCLRCKGIERPLSTNEAFAIPTSFFSVIFSGGTLWRWSVGRLFGSGRLSLPPSFVDHPWRQVVMGTLAR